MTGLSREKWAVLPLAAFFQLQPSIDFADPQAMQHRDGVGKSDAVSRLEDTADIELLQAHVF